MTPAKSKHEPEPAGMASQVRAFDASRGPPRDSPSVSDSKPDERSPST